MKKAKKTKKTLQVIRWKVNKEYIMELIEVVNSEEFETILSDAAKKSNEKCDEQYLRGAKSGFMLALQITHDCGDEFDE